MTKIFQELVKDTISLEPIADVIKRHVLSGQGIFADDTPSWVFERMFQQSDMYYFKETELVQLETEVSDELSTHYEKSEQFISDFAMAFAEVSE